VDGIRYMATGDWVFVKKRKQKAIAMTFLPLLNQDSRVKTILPLDPSFLPTHSSSQSYRKNICNSNTKFHSIHPFTFNFTLDIQITIKFVITLNRIITNIFNTTHTFLSQTNSYFFYDFFLLMVFLVI